MRSRIEITLGEVITGGNKVYGDGVNVASRIESLVSKIPSVEILVFVILIDKTIFSKKFLLMVNKMNRYEKLVLFVFFFVPVTLLWISESMVHSAEQSSGNYSIARSVMSGGGENIGSTNYKIQYTIGQATPVGTYSSSNYDNYAGFWFLGDSSTDTDGDGVPNEEDAFPNDPMEWLDTDNDGTGNNADPDDDNDGMPDTWEEQYNGLDPLVNDASQDIDGDGFKNIDEYRARTDPTDPESHSVRPKAMPWIPLLLDDE